MKLIIISLLLIFMGYHLSGEILFEYTDPAGDDYGAGQVVYPENPMFVEGIFDITSFKVEQIDNNYIFRMQFNGKIDYVEHAEFQYSYHLPDDFLLPLVHIYIDQDHVFSSGLIETIEGTNVAVEPESAWERGIVVTSLPGPYRGRLSIRQPVLENRIYIPEKIDIAKNKKEISVSVPLQFLGQFSSEWGFVVLVMSHEFSLSITNSIYIREVNSTATQFNFGGGEKNILTKEYDPNVIDLLASSRNTQEQMLSGYDREKKEFARIFAVYQPGAKATGTTVQGIVKQVSEEKVIINLGSEAGIKKKDKIIIAGDIIVIAEDVFPELTIASFTGVDDWKQVQQDMPVRLMVEEQDAMEINDPGDK
ncbi:MAG: hypothetical protein JXB60_04715 [Candidatus Cloacimonetes bacterium]|nr:hypothetical protein [Candidatus Cloacimonadota bacterium]